MKSWIFQANPKSFDIDAFLADHPGTFTWLVTRYANDINVGDRVYLWRAAAGDAEKAGVLAEAEVIAPVNSMIADRHTAKFWREQVETWTEENRVWMRLVRRGSAKEILRRDWLLEDPVLDSMLLLKQAAGTNFSLTEDEAQRLEQMWARVGQDWCRSESIAGLWAYVETIGKPVSRLSGSPVSTVSRLTGRAVAGVYNKVMNFRSIDPRDDRAGMSGAGAIDREVWREFFDPNALHLRSDELYDEFVRLWGDASIGETRKADPGSLNAATEREADRLASRPLSDLLKAYDEQASLSSRRKKPGVRAATSLVFERSSLVIAIAKVRANYRCEVNECAHPTFAGKDGKPYCEVHHIVPLSEGGRDTIDNTACICPGHHREVHLGARATELRRMLTALRQGGR
jgi:hypothetical protein